ncbi:unnamed protein product [Kuraishia capsulata CBS 1993]|uniref:superoxide dismutase n=1 Tax=Kuraishia capsulata CBS 1993 TaxID=1382522 RepID=W6MIM6_9ASCO|nr:uncharacterized protein KUCA_T00001748001 [Kuraishia capsulata CBS 1993]CDK25778.1 unnamed protein product [Kuraishia capsulata CBS 1993]
MVSLNSFVLFSAVLALGVSAGEAPVIKNNPKNVRYLADLDTGKVHGIIEFSAKNGTTKVHIDVTGLPDHGGPFEYHVHTNPVPANGNCEATGMHLNPYKAPAENCDALEDDSLCQVGDLSGKHGLINTTCFELTYFDPYLSLNPKDESFIGGRSVVLHYQNLERFACGNIVLAPKRSDFEEEEEDEDEVEEMLYKRHLHDHEHSEEEEAVKEAEQKEEEEEEDEEGYAKYAPNAVLAEDESGAGVGKNKSWNSSNVVATTTYCDGAASIFTGMGAIVGAVLAYMI